MRPAEAITWLRGAQQGVTPVLCLTGIPGPGKRYFIAEVLRAWPDPTPITVVNLDAPTARDGALRALAPFDRNGPQVPPPAAGTPLTLLVTEDLDALGDPDVAALLNVAMLGLDDLAAHRLAVLAGVTARPGGPFRGLTAEVAYQQPRTAALTAILDWVHQPDSNVLLVTGRPNSGKSVLARMALHEIGARDGLRVAHHVIWDEGHDPPPLRENVLVGGAIHELLRGFPQALGIYGTTVFHINQVVEGTAIAVNNPQLVATTLGMFFAQLDKRANVARDEGRTTERLVLIIDAVNVLDAESDGHQVLSHLLREYDRFSRWNLRLLLFSQYPPDGYPPALLPSRLDLDASADTDITAYVRRSLAAAGVEADPAAVARRVAGDFRLAGNFMRQARSSGTLPRTPVGDAGPVVGNHYAELLSLVFDVEPSRMARPMSNELLQDTERTLFLLAVTPYGLTETELARVWAVAGSEPGHVWHGSRTWWDARAHVSRGPLREYVRLPVGPTTGSGRVTLLDEEFRAAVRSRLPTRQSWTGLDRERRRFLRALTPLFPQGQAWDARAGRLALLEAPRLLAEVIAAAGTDEDPAWREAAGRLVGSWEWLDACLLATRTDSQELRLGPDVAADSLDLLRPLTTAGQDTELPHPARWISSPEPGPQQPLNVTEEVTRQPGLRIARVGQGLMVPLLSGDLRFDTRAQAVDFLNRIRAEYRVAKSHDHDDEDLLVIWVKGFGLTLEDWEEGYVGHYVECLPLPAGTHWRIGVHKKVVQPPKKHPDRRAARQPHPHWGELVLRRAVGNPRPPQGPRIYPTRAEAESQLDRLHEDYPVSTTWRTDRLGVLVYESWRRARNERPVRRYALTVEPAADGYLIRARYEDTDDEATDTA